MAYVKSTLEDIRQLWQENEEKQERSFEHMRRLLTENDVLRLLTIIDMNVERIRMKVDPEFAKQMIEDSVRRAKELLEEEEKKKE